MIPELHQCFYNVWEMNIFYFCTIHFLFSNKVLENLYLDVERLCTEEEDQKAA